MERFNQEKLNNVIDKLFNQIIEGGLDDGTSTLDTDHNITINFNQNNSALILLLLYLVNLDQIKHQETNIYSRQNNRKTKYNHTEIDDLIQIVENIQQKNKDFLTTLNKISSEET